MKIYGLDEEWYAAHDRVELAVILAPMIGEDEAVEEAESAREYASNEVFRVGYPTDALRSASAPSSAVVQPSENRDFENELVATAKDWAEWRISTNPEPDSGRMVATRQY